MSKKVLVLGEVRQEELRQVSFEAIAAAKRIAGEGEVVGVLLGSEAASFAQGLIQYGADRVLVVEHPHLQDYTPDGYTQAIMQVLEIEKPEGFILGHTSIGKDIAPRIAALGRRAHSHRAGTRARRRSTNIRHACTGHRQLCSRTHRSRCPSQRARRDLPRKAIRNGDRRVRHGARRCGVRPDQPAAQA